MADKFKELFDKVTLIEAMDRFQMFIEDKIVSPWQIIIDFTDGTTFRYFI